GVASEPGQRAGPGPEPGPRAGPEPGPRGSLGPGGAVETVVVATALGLVVVGQVGLLLGLAGLLTPGPILLALLGVHVASLPAWKSLLRGLGGLARGLGGRAEGGGEDGARR